MAKITLYQGNAKQEYPNANTVSVSPAGILTFYWQTQQRGANAQAYKFTTSVPYLVEEDIAVSS